MKRLHLIAMIVCMAATSIVGVSAASAAPINPPSTGCTLSNINTSIAGTGATVGGQYFYDDDTITFTTAAPVNFHVTNDYGLNYSLNNVTALTYNFPVTATYTYSITPVNGQPTYLKLSCKSTPISGGCIVSNDNFVGSFTLGSLGYNAGEEMKITSDHPVKIVMTGAASATYASTTSKLIIFSVTGTYTIKVISATKAVAHGQVTCTLPRRRIMLVPMLANQ